MKIEEVSKLSPLERFIYWMRERHAVYLRREAGLPKPWTDDEILQSYFFTNPYREHDKVTKWFRENIREPLRDDPRVLMATVIFRWFNLPETAVLLMDDTLETCPEGIDHWDYHGNLLTHWDPEEALVSLKDVRDRGEKIFTGAFMINSPGGEPKLEAIIRRISGVWERRACLLHEIETSVTLETAHKYLIQHEGLGGFMAYEIVCDLRYTYLLEEAPDKKKWCNPGPGAIRGLYRLRSMDFPKGNNSSSPPRPKDWDVMTRKLLYTVEKRLVEGSNMPPMEMREIEHSLCEWDKYERARLGDGQLKRRYNGR